MDRTAITDQMDRILRSQTFARKSQLRKLLEVLFKNMNSQAMLKPDLVIRELWPEETRTKRSADVAAEMNRLRHALESYYNGEGKADTITISLPNRSVTAVDGTQEKYWIVAKPRGGIEDHPPGPQAKPLRRAKIMGAIAALGAALGIAAYISIRVLAVPDQPKLGRLDGSALVIMNAGGKELWRKAFPEGFGPDWYYAQWQPTRIWFGDLEGKGHTSVLFSLFPSRPAHAFLDTDLLLRSRGREMAMDSRKRAAGARGESGDIHHSHRGVLRATDKRPPRIVVSSQYSPWWPNQIALLDSNGKIISEYWHSGSLNLTLADLDGDGREEIIAAGVANGYDHQATLVVLDPDRVFGASTEVRPEFQIHGMGVAQERLRLLFPRSDLNKALFQYNAAIEPAVEHGRLGLSVLECITPYPGGCRIYYEFDKNFRLIAAYAGSDEFRSAHNRFYQAGKNAHRLSAEEQAAFQKVRCLVGCKSEFVPVGKLVH